MTKKKVTELTKKIIEYSKENTAGSLLTEDGIKAVLDKCDKKTDSKLFIEARIDENQSDSGYLVKVADFLDALKPERPEQTETPEPPERKEPKLHRKEFFQFIDHEFTDKEILDFSKNLSKILNEIDEVESRKKSAVSQFKSEIDKLISEVKELANKINTGSEERNVKCEALFFYDKNEKHIVRMDNGEVIWNGEIPEHERQVEAFDKSEKRLEPDSDGTIELIPKSDENTTPEQQPPDTEPDTPETGQSSSEGTETEESQDEKLGVVTQEDLDREDAETKEKITHNFDGSEHAEEKDSSMPPLPNE